ncbi:MAG: NAD-dependent protein deacylase [Clostridiales bacterium]|nr:NAD-dependent protein deacylase [Clostridiales bacterium]
MVLQALKSMLDESENIVFFGGAGVSTESGIPDFRSEAGIYETEGGRSYPPEYLLSHSFFVREPGEFYKFYRSKMIYPDAKPNNAHIALARLEDRGKLKAVVTQNIDGLHQAAGSKNVLELHGSVHRNYCMECGREYAIESVTESKTMVPRCDSCRGIIRPDVVLYEEQLDSEVMRRAADYISAADMLIVGGTSLVVNPAASFVSLYTGKRLVLINKSPTPYDDTACLVINDSIGRVLDGVVSH